MLVTRAIELPGELEQILELQQQYLKGKKPAGEEADQGFVTVEHKIDVLKKMHAYEPSIIAMNADKLIAYALVMVKECRAFCPELVPMFNTLDQLNYKGRPLNDYNFYTMGQICVDKPWRGFGVFDLLYKKHKELLSSRYDFVVTSISLQNGRSLRAHERVGFRTLHQFADGLGKWVIVLWDWNGQP